MSFTIIIAHRSNLLCEVLREALHNRNFKVLSYATSGTELERSVLLYQPDIVIMSNDLPNTTGVDIVKLIHQKKLECKFMFLSQNESEAQYLNSNIQVEGHVHSWVNMSEFFYCLQEIISDRTYISNVIEKFIQEVTDNDCVNYDPSLLKNLTPREKDIMKALSKTYTTPKIADMFFISTATVNNHRAKIMEKLNIRGRNQLLSVALSLRPYLS